MFLGNFLGNKKVNRFKTILVFMHLMLFLPKKKKNNSSLLCVCMHVCVFDRLPEWCEHISREEG